MGVVGALRYFSVVLPEVIDRVWVICVFQGGQGGQGEGVGGVGGGEEGREGGWGCHCLVIEKTLKDHILLSFTNPEYSSSFQLGNL